MDEHGEDPNDPRYLCYGQTGGRHLVVGDQYAGEVRLSEPFLEPIPEPIVLCLTDRAYDFARRRHHLRLRLFGVDRHCTALEMPLALDNRQARHAFATSQRE